MLSILLALAPLAMASNSSLGALADGTACHDHYGTVLDFGAANMTHSNLGGQGPDFAFPPTIRFTNVGLSNDGRPLALEISNLTAAQDTYDPRAEGTMRRSEGRFGRLGLRAPAATAATAAAATISRQ